ncbi:MAG TPA: SOS response-associated peptidase [Ktedonobacteraceae bacterium]|nr:SOS response-associated peptidase [Ktedonobacteraceae bacterium]
MCGRFTLITDVRRIAESFGVAPALDIQPRYNIAPTQDVVAILKNGTAHMSMLRWGLIPAWAKDETIGSRMINARAETLAEKASFKHLLRGKRCLVVADGFYEWRADGKGKTPMYITRQDEQPFAFAGLWDLWKSPDGQQIQSCTIITTEPNELMATIHNRMPAILRPGAYEDWLDPQLRDEEVLTHWLAPYPAELMKARPVSKLVNNPRNDTAEILAPVV